MATNVFRHYTEAKTEEWEVPSGTLAGVVVIQNVDGRPGVTLTARGDATQSITLPNGVVATIPVGGVGNKPDTAVVAVDGDFLLDVAGVTAGETTGAGETGTPAGTDVFRTTATGAITLTATGGVKIGVIAPAGRIIGTIAPVSIGVDL